MKNLKLPTPGTLLRCKCSTEYMFTEPCSETNTYVLGGQGTQITNGTTLLVLYAEPISVHRVLSHQFIDHKVQVFSEHGIHWIWRRNCVVVR